MERDAIIRPLTLAVTLTLGIGLVWGVVVTWATVIVSEVVHGPQSQQIFCVLDDGTPFVQTYQSAFPDGVYDTLDGEPISPDKSQSRLAGASLSARPAKGRAEYRVDWNHRLRSFSDGKRLATFWYCIQDGHRDGKAYFVGYDSRSKRRIGYLGQDGFSENMPELERHFSIGRGALQDLLSRESYHVLREPVSNSFSNYRDRVLYFVAGHDLVAIDLRDRTVKTILSDPDLKSVGYLHRSFRSEPGGTFQPLGVRFADRIEVRTTEGMMEVSYTIPDSLRSKRLTAYLLPDERMLLVHAYRSRRRAVDVTSLYWIDQEGNVLDERQEDLKSTGAPQDAGRIAWLICAGVPAPVVAAPVAFWTTPACESDSLEMGYWDTLPIALPKIWPAIAATCVLSIVLAYLTVRRQRRFSLGGRKTWAVFVLLFGLPGYLGYLCHRRWPTRQPCTECHEPTPRDRDACAFCHTRFPEPERKGTEIFVTSP